MTTGTVQIIPPLSQGEAWEFAAALMQQAPRDLDPEKVRHYLRNKTKLGGELRELLGKPLPAFDTSQWERRFELFFHCEFDLSGLHVPLKLEYPCWAIIVPPRLTNNRAFEACAEAFKSWRYVNDLDTVVDVVTRPEGPYVVWVRETIEADPDMANKSAVDIEAASTNTLTLKERMLLELLYFDTTSKHLDLSNWTLCAGSRPADGSVPLCGWYDGGFGVAWAGVDDRDSRLRARVAVS